MNIMVLFESEKESYTYNPLVEKLKENHQVELHILSVYEDLKKIENLVGHLQSDLIIAGSGFSAALPGIVSSLTNAPVIGLPVESQFGGLDSLFSMLQTPLGHPVICSSPGNYERIADFLNLITPKMVNKKGINIVVDPGVRDYEYVNSEITRTQILCEDKGLDFAVSDAPNDQYGNIRLVTEEDQIDEGSVFVHVPVVDSTTRDKPTEAMVVYEWINKGGLWLGVDNTRNAVHAFLRFRNMLRKAK